MPSGQRPAVPPPGSPASPTKGQGSQPGSDRKFGGPELVRRALRHEAYLVAIRDAYEKVRLSFEGALEYLAESGTLGRMTSLEVLDKQIDSARPDLSRLTWLVEQFDRFDLGDPRPGFSHPTPMPPDPFAYDLPRVDAVQAAGGPRE
jgi:hypothetical protein